MAVRFPRITVLAFVPVIALVATLGQVAATPLSPLMGMDAVSITAVSPPVGTVIPNGTTFQVSVHVNLVSLPSATLLVGWEQFPGQTTCDLASPNQFTNGGTSAHVIAGTNDLALAVPWQGGSGTGVIGLIARLFDPAMNPGTLFVFFSPYCYQYSAPVMSTSQPFIFLKSGFTQQLYGTSPHFMGGVAFAPNGDVWVDDCGFINEMHRFDAHTVATVHGSAIHPQTPVVSGAGCGLTNYPDGFLYSNRGGTGVVRLDANTGTQLSILSGTPGTTNNNGIAPNPVTGELVYAGADGTLFAVQPNSGTVRTFSTVLTGMDVDGLYFKPDGTRVFAASRSPLTRVAIIKADGTLDQFVPLPAPPDGIAFHQSGHVITNNNDGTMSDIDLSTSVPTVSLFASGGFRGDLTQVGPDGCLYATQLGTRYADGTISGDNSLVRICGDFIPPQYQVTQFVIWGGNAGGVQVGQHVLFWGAQWDKQVTAGDYQANASFKGYADTVTDRTWTARPGNSSQPPASIPQYISVLVATHISKSGSTISGNIAQIAVLKVDTPSSYQPDPGHPASGTVVALLSVP